MRVGGGKVVIVVNEVPDSLTIPDSVETEPSLLVTSHVVVNSVVTSAATLDEGWWWERSDRGEGSTRFTNNTRLSGNRSITVGYFPCGCEFSSNIGSNTDGVGGGNVVIVVNEVPDSLTIPDSVETDPSLLVTSMWL